MDAFNLGGLTLRPYRGEDLTPVIRLFSDTVQAINARDYTPAQVEAWVGGVDARRWAETLEAHFTRVAWLDGCIVGFGDLDGAYLDRLYVHKDCQGRGIGTALCDDLERRAWETGVKAVTTHASVTAKPFFEARGYYAERKQRVLRKNIYLDNFIMSKKCDMLCPASTAIMRE